jgi:hypothetical protein
MGVMQRKPAAKKVPGPRAKSAPVNRGVAETAVGPKSFGNPAVTSSKPQDATETRWADKFDEEKIDIILPMGHHLCMSGAVEPQTSE